MFSFKRRDFLSWCLFLATVLPQRKVALAKPYSKPFNVCLQEETIPLNLSTKKFYYFLDIIYEMYRHPTGLDFRSTCEPENGKVDMFISFEDIQHAYRQNSYSKPCKFQSYNIAHAYYPPEHDIHINNHKLFTTFIDNEIDEDGKHFAILKVLLHEFGHAMGLDHNLDLDSIMNLKPFTNYAINHRDHETLYRLWHN